MIAMSDELMRELEAAMAEQKPQAAPTGSQTTMPTDWEAKLSELPSAPAPEAPGLFSPEELQYIEGKQNRPGYVQAFTAGVERNWGQIKSIAPTLEGMYAEATGDQAGAARSFAESQQIQDAAPKQLVPNFTHIHDWDDFSTWLTERLGEQSLTMLSMAATGGATGLAANVTGRGLMMSSAGRAALTKYSATAGAGLAGTALETSGTADELKQATGSYHPGLSVGAGAVKGMLEIYTPAMLIRGLSQPGKALGTEIAKNAFREGLTESAQEAIDVAARKYADPNFQFFTKENGVRVIEAGLAGFAVGGIYGGGVEAIAGRHGQKPGQEKELTAEDIAAYEKKAANEKEASKPTWNMTGPLGWLRNRFQRRTEKSQDQTFENETVSPSDPIDVGSTMLDLRRDEYRKKVGTILADQIDDLIDDSTPRYVLMRADGKSDGRLYTRTDLETAQTLLPQGEQVQAVKVDLQQLAPGHITAEVRDLPTNPSSRRIYMLPGTTEAEEKSLREQYASLVPKIQEAQAEYLLPGGFQKAEQLLPAYNELLKAGLRVIPERKQSFHYSGGVTGTRVNVNQIKSGRGLHKVNSFAIENGMVKAGKVLSSFASNGDVAPMVLDLDKIEPDNIIPMPDHIAIASLNLTDVVHPEGMTTTQAYDKLEEAANKRSSEARAAAFKQLAEQGIQITNLHQFDSLTLKKDVSVRDVTFSPFDREDKNNPYNPRAQRTERPLLVDQVGERNSSNERMPEKLKVRTELVNKVKALMPYINGLTDKLGMPRISIVIEDEGVHAAGPHWLGNTNTIHLPTQGGWLNHLQDEGWTSSNVLNVILHEIGHSFTLWNWQNLPASIQEQVQRGHQLARLHARVLGYNTRSGNDIFDQQAAQQNAAYWSTFSEYLAEQFRRWAMERLQKVSYGDQFFADVARGLDKFSDVFVEKVWPQAKANFNQADYRFHVWMDYFEGLRKANPDVRGLLATRAKMNVNELRLPKWTEKHKTAEVKAVIKLVKRTVDNFRHLLPAGWSAEVIVPEAEKGVDSVAAGLADRTDQLIRIIASNLASHDPLQVPLTFIHETVHAVYTRLTEAEKAMLLAEARKQGVKINEKWYRDYYDKVIREDLGEDPTSDPAMWEHTIQTWIDEEYIAAFFEHYAQNKFQESKARDFFNAMQQLMAEVTTYIQGQFATVDDLMRAFYRGEIAARMDPDIAPMEQVDVKVPVGILDPKTIWHREQSLSEIRKGMEIDAARAAKAMTGEQVGPTVSPYDQLASQTANREQMHAAKVLGIPFDQAAPSQIETEGIKNILGNAFRGEHNKRVNRHLSGRSSQVGLQADRISWFSKIFFGLHQLAWRNQHVEQLRDYVSLAERWNAARMKWVSRADDTARKWEKLPTAQRNALSDILFWATEMRYRTPAEVRANVIRPPTQQELMAEFAARRMTPDAVALYSEVRQRFDDFLTDVERVSRQNIAATIRDPAQQQRALLELANDMAQMRRKPYFPMIRFGEWTITVRDPGQNDKVVWFSAYASAAERDAAVVHVARQHRLHRIQIGRMVEEAHEFMGLPAPLLRQIKNNLPGISQTQMEWIDRLMHLNAPENSFRKRWLARSGTPGYSLDAFRAFAHYFVKGGNYLARIEYNKPLSDQIQSLRKTMPLLRDTYRRGLMVEYMQKHHRYIMEGGQDWAKAKALFAIWQLGYSPVAAGMNLLQNVQVGWPYFTSLFGNAKGTAAMMRAMASLRRTFTFNTAGQSSAFIAAREELVAQGKIDVGLAPELGNFAEGNRLHRLMAGDALQKAWRNVMYYGMIGFQYTEKFNRNLTFAVAWDLANANPNHPILRQIHAHRINEVFDIASRRGLSHNQAAAVIFAREAIDRTQFIYSPLSRAPFLRSGPMSAFMVFFSYTQSMLYAMRHNPGAAKMWLISLALFGLAGLPGADDLNELIKLAARRGLGINFNPQKEVRKFIHEVVKGTVFERTGPDLMLHGVSRYSFGVGLMAEGWGVPRFDASVNGSLAKIVPGLADLARNMSTVSHDTSWKDVTADLARNSAGAGFGQMFALLKFLQAPPGTDEWKKWEGILPRAAKAVSKAVRYTVKGQETSMNGGKFVGFDAKDPDDRATIIAQALGFNPTKVTTKWEAVLSIADDIKFYQSRKLSLLAQLDDAVKNKESATIREITHAIQLYNKEVKDANLTGLGLDSDTIRQSLMARARNRVQMEMDIPQMKKTLPFVQKEKELWDLPKPRKVQ